MVILVEDDGCGSVLSVDVDESESELDETFEATEETIERSTGQLISIDPCNELCTYSCHVRLPVRAHCQFGNRNRHNEDTADCGKA